MTKGQKHIKRICADICNKLGGHTAHLAKEILEYDNTRPITYYGVHQFNNEGPMRARVLLGNPLRPNHVIYEVWAPEKET